MCGACCKHIDRIFENVGEIVKDPKSKLHFPYKFDETGRCEMLNDDNSCKVYKNRPLICNIPMLQKELKIPKQEFFSINVKSCNKLMEEDGIPEKFRIS